MAVLTRKLVCKFKDASGDTVTHSYNHIANEVEESDVKALMNTMITNGAIYAKPPVSKLSADIVVTDSTAVDVSDD